MLDESETTTVATDNRENDLIDFSDVTVKLSAATGPPVRQASTSASFGEDQWSPIDLYGKKQYDRDFLLKFRTTLFCKTRPSHLPDLEIIKDKPMEMYINCGGGDGPNRPGQGFQMGFVQSNFSSTTFKPHPARGRLNQQERKQNSMKQQSQSVLQQQSVFPLKKTSSVLLKQDSKCPVSSDICLDQQPKKSVSNADRFQERNATNDTMKTDRKCLQNNTTPLSDKSSQADLPVTSAISNDLNLFLRSFGCTPPRLLNWIRVHVDKPKRYESEFISTLVTAIVTCTCHCDNQGIYRQDDSKLRSYCEVVAVLINRSKQVDVELSALLAIERVWGTFQRPPNMLGKLFAVFYDEEVISLNTFFQWRSLEVSEQPEDHAAAILGLQTFFEYLTRVKYENEWFTFCSSFFKEKIPIPAASDEVWRPYHLATDAVADQVILFRNVRAALNKITPQNFQKIMSQMSNLHIATEKHLEGVIKLVFEKAVGEEMYTVSYASMCKHLSSLKVPSDNNPDVVVSFKKQLITQCQLEFERDADDEFMRDERQKKIRKAESAEKKQELQEELEDAARLVRMRSLRNIRFMGELFKLGILTPPIMRICLTKLTKADEEISVECLCHLLTVIGKDLDRNNSLPRPYLEPNWKVHSTPMDAYFETMKILASSIRLPNRVKFMLLDVIDLRKRNWVPRRAENKPNTIDQIHQNTKKEVFNRYVRSGPLVFPDEKRVKSLLEEFFHNMDFEEAIACIKDTCSSSGMPMFINSAVNQVLERSQQSRNHVGQLLKQLVQQSIATFEQYCEGFKEVLASAEDFEIDVPKFWEHVADILCPIFEVGVIPLSELKVVTGLLPDKCHGGKLFANVMIVMQRNVGAAKIKEIWSGSGLSIACFLPPDVDMNKFVLINDLEFLLVGAAVPETSDPNPKQSVEKDLTYQLQNVNVNSEGLFDWIDGHTSQAQRREPQFIRALVTAIASVAINRDAKGEYILNTVQFESYCKVIKRFVDAQEALELATLLALQVHWFKLQQPKNIINQLFNALFDLEVISMDAFDKWKTLDAPNQMEGHAVAVKAVNPFLDNPASGVYENE